MAHDLFAQDAWTRARDRFIEDLSESERSLYHQSSLEMILYDASAAQKRHQDTSISRDVISKLQPLTSAIEQYGQALDVYANAYPLALSPLWGSLRVVLLLAREFGKYFEKLVDMFEHIGDVLPRFRAYERLFPNHERLVQSLSIVYVDILKFCSDVKTVLRRGKRSSIVNLKIFSKLVWKPFDLQFGDRLRKFREHKKTVEKEVELSHMIESAESRELMLANRLQLEREKREQDRSRMLSQLSDVSHEDLHRIQRQLYHPGTGLWALQSQEYLEWKSSGSSAGLCCYGIPGSGKSILASTVIEDMVSEERTSSIYLVYFYCSYADPRSLTKSQILGNLLRQLILKGAVSEEAERGLLTDFLKNERNPEDNRLIQEIWSTIESRRGLYIIFDGLDECNDETIRFVLDFLSRLTKCRPVGARVFVTCREESQVLEFVQSWPQLQLDENALVNDIQSFAASSVRSRIEKGELKIADPSLENEIVTTLAEKAHGMFLWVHFQLIDLCAALSVAQIRITLDDLPDGLGDTYERILTHIGKNKVKSRFARKLFRWLACARRPLRIEEMQEAVAFDQSDKEWDAEKIPDADLLLRSCHSLVTRDHDNATVRFAHYTIQQYLVFVSSWSSPEVRKGSAGYEFEVLLEDAETDAARVCIAYLNFSDFETAVAPRASDLRFSNTGILGPSGPGTIASTLGLGKPVVDVVYRVLGGHARSTALDIDYAKYLNIRPKAAAPKTSEKYMLLDYIVRYWPWHVDNCTSLDNRTTSLTVGLVNSKILPFEFRPWGPNRHFGPYGCKSCWMDAGEGSKPGDLRMTSAIHWAAEHGLVNFLSYIRTTASHDPFLLDQDALHSHLIHEKYSNETLLIACQSGRLEMVVWLLKAHEGHRIKIQSFSKLCMAASASGNATILEALLDFITGSNLIEPARNTSLLQEVLHRSLFDAATLGYTSVVEFLFDFTSASSDPAIESYINHLDELTGRSPLHSAAANGHHVVVKLLAEGFLTSLDFPDRDTRSTALHYAAKSGHDRVVTELLSHGSSVECRDSEKMTPLDLAAKNGHLAVVKCLLEGGSSVDAKGTSIVLGHPFQGGVWLGPLEWASAGGHNDVVDFLLDYDPYLRRGTRNSSISAVHLATIRGYVNTLRKLLDRGAVDERGSFGFNGIHLAAWYGHSDCLELLASRGTSLNDATEGGDGLESALHIATEQGHCNAISALERLGAELKVVNSRIETAFEVSIARMDEATALALLQAEQAQGHRPRLWKLLTLIMNEIPYNGALHDCGSEKEPQQCIKERNFNKWDVMYAQRCIIPHLQNNETHTRVFKQLRYELMQSGLEGLVVNTPRGWVDES